MVRKEKGARSWIVTTLSQLDRDHAVVLQLPSPNALGILCTTALSHPPTIEAQE